MTDKPKTPSFYNPGRLKGPASGSRRAPKPGQSAAHHEPANASPNVRAVAAEVLYGVCHEGQSLTGLLPAAQLRVAEADRALLQELCFGACRWYHRLHHIVRSMLVRPLKGRETYGRQLLIIGLYQLLETRIPPHAAIHETVEASKVLDVSWLSGVINGVLRNFLREIQLWRERIEATPLLIHSHPLWLAEKLRHNWPDESDAIMQANNARPPFTLRVNPRHHSRVEYLQQLADAGLEAQPAPYAPYGVTLTAPVDVARLPGFAQGWVSVQDEAAQLCVDLLALSPGMRVLDACAAPGGKTCAMLEACPELTLVALDCDAHRLERVRENLARLHLSAELVCADGVAFASQHQGDRFDRILLDAPCSATGVIRRHPDIKLLRKETDILPLAKVQMALLTHLWPLLKPGGQLLYATCSVFPQENNRIIERFLQQQSDARADTLEAAWGIATSTGARQLLPQINGHDGFFYARLYKKV